MDKAANGKSDRAHEEIRSTVVVPSDHGSCYVHDGFGGDVAYVMRTGDMGDAYKQRLIAAFNACQGLEIHHLRSLGVGGVGKLLECIDEMTKRSGGRIDTRPEQQKVGADRSGMPLSVEQAEQIDLDDMRNVVRLVELDSGQRPRWMRTVYVVAWRFNSGSGFQWFDDDIDANEAFNSERKNCIEMRHDLWRAWRFDVQVDRRWPGAQVTAMIESHLGALCAAAPTHCSYDKAALKRKA